MRFLNVLLALILTIVYTLKVDAQALKELTLEQSLIIVCIVFLTWCLYCVLKDLFKKDR